MMVMDRLKSAIRASFRQLAVLLNKLSGGKITPNHITIFGLVAHVPIAYLIAVGNLKIAALLLIVFGLFDVLDGELARVQKSTSAYGMFLDSVTDRIKEIMIYIGIAAWLFYAAGGAAVFLVATGALGVSLLISYLNAWGEAVLSRTHPQSSHKVNQALRGGLMGFDVRMAFVAAGLLADRLELAVMVIFVLGSLTALQRLNSVLNRLKNV
jgi:phosphatidylglycerophosphate synthase